MKVTQIATLMNTVTQEILGKTDLVNEDLSNIVDVGTEILNVSSVDNYVKTLVNHIGRMIFVDRPYYGSAPSILMDSWDYGSVLEKIKMELPEAEENESWELTDGQTYNQDIFTAPKVSAKFFNGRVTFEIPMSFAETRVTESLSSVAQLNAFISMIYNHIEKSMNIKLDSLIMRTINNMIAGTINAEFAGGAGIDAGSGVRVINLLYLYNQKFDPDLTAAEAIYTPDFIRFAALQMGLYEARLTSNSSLFNVGGNARQTPPELLHVVMLSEFYRAASVYLQSDTFHNELTALPRADEVPYWQGSGLNYDFSKTSAINVAISNNGGEPVTINTNGVIGVMFDRDALGVTNMNRRTTTHYNGKAEFVNQWYKMDAGYFNDYDENFVVFLIA